VGQRRNAYIALAGKTEGILGRLACSWRILLKRV
jgi:hypothetical protein